MQNKKISVCRGNHAAAIIVATTNSNSKYKFVAAHHGISKYQLAISFAVFVQINSSSLF
jgi:hypothetical protein